MLVGGDLGFWLRLLLGGLIGPGLGLVVRYKWRRAVARREEVRRLCVLAAEEAVMAELAELRGGGYEVDDRTGTATGTGTGTGRGLRVCAVCGSVTKQKCANCKAVYYCSGKCQIAHWRQGHKDECRPYNLNQKKESTMTSRLKVSNQEENKRDDKSFETGEDSDAKPSETSNDSSSFPDSGPYVVHSRKDDLEVEHLEDDKWVSAPNGSHVSQSSHSSIISNKPLSAKVIDSKIQTAPANNVWSDISDSGREFSISSVNDTPHKNSQIRPSCDDKDKDCTTSTVSDMGVSLSVKSSSCQPSTSTSDFWEGKLVRRRCKTDSPDESAVDDRDVTGSQISPAVTAKTALLSRSPQTIQEIKKPANLNTHFAEETEGDVSRESLKSTRDGLSHVKPTGSSSKPIPHPAKLSPSTLTDKVESTTRGITKSGISSLNKLGSTPSNSVISKQTVDPLPSTTRKHVESMNAVKGVNTHSVTTCSKEFSGLDHNAKHAIKPSVQKVLEMFKTSTPLKQRTRGSGTEIMTKYKGLFPYELFVRLYNWKEVEFRPCGFVNCGNSCYANAVLQCLASTPPLTSYFLQGLHSKSCERRDWCFMCEFESLMLKAKDGDSILSPIRIISHLQNIGSHLRNGREEDAHEFLRYAIDAMQSTSLKEAGVKESGSLEEGTTLVGLTFGGIIRSKIGCMRCGRNSERQERMMDLTVEIDGDIGTLEEALKQYTSVETLDGDNKYFCDWCKSYEKAKKKLKVLEAPNVLTIALKRYQSGRFGKLNKTVQFPEILNLAPYICGTSDKSPIYGLYGVIVHLDTMNAAFSGHYVCYVKSTQNQWFMADDSVVKRVDIGKVLTKDAYMLLYARYSPRAPKLFRNSVIPRDPKMSKYHKCTLKSLTRDSWNVSTGEDPLNDEACHECSNTVHSSLMPGMRNPDYGSSSDSSSFFSDSGSYGTDSSNRESASTDEHLDYGVMSAIWNNSGRSSSDSDTSSSSSSPSPLFLRKSPLSDAVRCSPVTGVETTKHGSSFYGIQRSASSGDLDDSNCEEDNHFRHPDSSKHLKQFSSSSRENETNRLGRINPFNKVKYGFPFRRSTNYDMKILDIK